MRDLKKLEKKHGQLRKRRMEEMTSFERIWNYYFNMEYDIMLTPAEEITRQIYETAYNAVLKYFPAYSIHRVASFLARHLEEKQGIERTHRQCITYVNESINLFGEPVEIDKEKRKQLYISRLNLLSMKAEQSQDFNAAQKAIAKAAELENFNVEADEKFRDMMKNMEAKEVVFASSMDQLKELVEQRRKRLLESSDEAEIVEDED